MKININEYIYFKLTKSGKDILEIYEYESSQIIGRPYRMEFNKDGFYEMQMWKAIEIFKDGIGICLGESPFDKCEIFTSIPTKEVNNEK